MDEDLLQAADELGFRIIPDPDAALRFGIEKVVGSGRIVTRMRDVLERAGDGVRFVVATIRHRHSGDSSPGAVNETILYFSQQGLQCVDMSVQPRGTLVGLQSAVLGLVGVPSIEFQDDEPFNSQYRVMTLQPESARALLDPAVREYLATHPGLTVRTEADRIAVYRAGRSVPADELAEFVDETNDVVMQLVRRAREQEQIGLSPADEGRETLQNMHGIGAMVARRMLVSQQELEQFLSQPPPRDLPASIRRQHLGFVSQFFYIWGGMFLLVGTIVLIGLGAANAAPWPAIAAGSLAPLMGLTAILLAYRHRRRKRRLLQHGDCRTARVSDVKATNVYVNNRRRYKVTFVCTDGGSGRPYTVNAYDPAVQKAFALAESGASTRLLVDPVDARNALWIDGLAAG
jgi:hypothetical protein